MSDTLLLMAEITGVHGIKGDVKLRLYGEDTKLLTKHTMLDDKGNTACTIVKLRGGEGFAVATIEGLVDRTQAEKWRGKKLYLPRDILPKIKKKNTFYHVDLIGLEARHVDGHTLGKIVGVANYGAGDLLDIKPAKGSSFFVPFRDEIVPDVDIDAGYVTVDPPPGLLD